MIQRSILMASQRPATPSLNAFASLSYYFDESLQDEPNEIRGFNVPFLNRFTHGDCSRYYARPIYYFAILNVNLSDRAKNAFAASIEMATQHATKLRLKASGTRVKIEGLIVLWLIFNLSRLYPTISRFTPYGTGSRARGEDWEPVEGL